MEDSRVKRISSRHISLAADVAATMGVFLAEKCPIAASNTSSSSLPARVWTIVDFRFAIPCWSKRVYIDSDERNPVFSKGVFSLFLD